MRYFLQRSGYNDPVFSIRIMREQAEGLNSPGYSSNRSGKRTFDLIYNEIRENGLISSYPTNGLLKFWRNNHGQRTSHTFATVNSGVYVNLDDKFKQDSRLNAPKTHDAIMDMQRLIWELANLAGVPSVPHPYHKSIRKNPKPYQEMKKREFPANVIK